MNNFKEFNIKLQKQFELLCSSGKLYRLELPTLKDSDNNDITTGYQIVGMYLNSFKPENDNVFRVNSEHDCNNDKNFIRRYGNVVAIGNDNKIITLWDLELDSSDAYYDSCKSISNLLHSNGVIGNIFMESFDFLHKSNYEKTNKNMAIYQLGVKNTFKVYTHEEAKKYGGVEPNKTYEFNHFHVYLPKVHVNFTNSSVETIQETHRSSKNVFKRALDEISLDTLELVRDLINQGSLLNGESHLYKINDFINYKKEYIKITDNKDKDNWCWLNSYNLPIAKFRNELIGTLCVELSEGVELNKACSTWNKRVDPVNYMKAKSPITESQKKEAIKVINDLGYEDSFNRRLASIDDINVNEIIYSNVGDGTIKNASIFDKMTTTPSTRHKKSQFDGVEEVSIEKFMKDILPTSTQIEVFFENRMENNLVVMHTSENKDCKLPFKWNNPFGWTYNGNLAGKSEIKENVKNAGGKIDGVLRCSLQWNDEDSKGIVDFDLHCLESKGEEIYYSHKKSYKTNGWLDVDMINPTKIGIENITWQNKLPDMAYKFFVRNFNGRDNTGFKIEIEFDGNIYNYHYKQPANGDVNVATVTVTNGIMEITHHLPESSTTKKIWNIETNNFNKVNLVCLSPNYWGDNNYGNKHYLFMIEDCKTETSIKGFHSEFLNNELSTQPTRKFIDIFGNYHQIEPNNKKHLAGLGFNSTVKDELILRVKGSHQRVIKIKF